MAFPGMPGFNPQQFHPAMLAAPPPARGKGAKGKAWTQPPMFMPGFPPQIPMPMSGVMPGAMPGFPFMPQPLPPPAGRGDSHLQQSNFPALPAPPKFGLGLNPAMPMMPSGVPMPMPMPMPLSSMAPGAASSGERAKGRGGREGKLTVDHNTACEAVYEITSRKYSKYKGVSWNRVASKWRALITIEGRRRSIGDFDDEDDAARRYDEKAFELNKPLNFPEAHFSRDADKPAPVAALADQAKAKRGTHGIASRFKGVTWNKADQKWKGQIKINGKTVHLGLFLTEEDAARKYNEIALKLGRPLNQLADGVLLSEDAGSRKRKTAAARDTAAVVAAAAAFANEALGTEPGAKRQATAMKYSVEPLLPLPVDVNTVLM